MLTLAIKNISKEKISVFIRYLKNGPYPLTKDAGSCILVNSSNERIEIGKIPVQDKAFSESDYVILNPDESREFQIKLNDYILGELKPDTYTLKYSNTGHDYYYEQGPTPMRKVKYPWTGTVVSNEITIKVAEENDLGSVKDMGGRRQPQENARLSLTLSSDTQVYEEDNPIIISLIIRNMSREKVNLFTPYLESLHRAADCIILNSKNEEIPYTVKAQSLTSASGNLFVSLEPNEAQVFKFDIYQSIQERLKPDTYSITYYYRGWDVAPSMGNMILPAGPYPWRGEVASNKIIVQVMANGTLEPVKKAWKAFLDVLKSGDENKARQLSTNKGYKSLFKFVKPSMPVKETLKNLGNRWSNSAIRWQWITQTSVNASIGPEIKESGIDFIKVDNEWKFDNFSPGE